MLRVAVTTTVLVLLVQPVSAQTADEIIAKYVETIGGMPELQAVKTLRRAGKLQAGGGFEMVILYENKRPNLVRQNMTMQGMTGVAAYDGQSGWKIEPWAGRKDPEPLGEDEMKAVLEDADFDGPLINYREKGNKVEYVGLEPVEGTDAFKLKVTLKNGDVRYYYMDTDYYVPIKIESKRMVRGAELEFETTLGDYKQVAGIYSPHSAEINTKGSSEKQKLTFEKIEANVPIDDSRFVAPGSPPRKPQASSPPSEETAKTIPASS